MTEPAAEPASLVDVVNLLDQVLMELEGIDGLLTLGLLQQGLTIEQIDTFVAKQLA